ncbi:hypothetical protein BKA60DRAFT_540282 [Fusarium oxysporum]|nr:hypothetical protein BKA60DRAFT_540282 [Fusarium oxysporum]
MSPTLLTQSSDIDPFDEGARRVLMTAYFQSKGLYSAAKTEERYEYWVGHVARCIHIKENVTQIGHLYFEFAVDQAIWEETFYNNGATPINMAPRWPWPEEPRHHDMSQNLSLRYRQWRIDNNLPVDTAEAVDPVPLCMVQEPSLAKRKEIWEDVYGDKPYNGDVVGPFELGLPRDLYFRHLVLGDKNAVYARLPGLINHMLVVTWTIVDGKAASLIVGVDPKYKACSDYPYVRMEVRRLWLQICGWLKTVKQGNNVTVADHLANALNSEKSLARFDTFDV